MAVAYELYAPINVLKAMAEDVWIVDGPQIHFRLGPLRVPFPTRMTVIRLSSGHLWIHSPIEPADGLVAAIRELGTVDCLIAPNSIHYWWVGDWKALFPEAEVWAAPNLAKRAADRMPMHRTLTAKPPERWADVIDQVLVPGSRITEVDFFHRPSATLILTDLIENFEPRRFRSRFYKLLTRMGGAMAPDGKAPFDLQRTFRKTTTSVRVAVEQMIAWKPRRIVIAHGRCYEDNAVTELRRAFRWAR